MLSGIFPIKNFLKQEDSFLPLFFKSALDYGFRNFHVNQDGLNLNGTHQLLVNAKNFNILGGNLHVYIGFKTFFYVIRHLDAIASYLPTGLHLGFFCSWPLFHPTSFSSVFLVLCFVLASTSMLFLAVFLLPFFEHGHTM